MTKYINVAKGKHVIIQQMGKVLDDIDFGNEVEVDRIKYLTGTITSVGAKTSEEVSVGMKVKCAAFVAVSFGDGEYGLNEEDIMCEIKEVTEWIKKK